MSVYESIEIGRFCYLMTLTKHRELIYRVVITGASFIFCLFIYQPNTHCQNELTSTIYIKHAPFHWFYDDAGFMNSLPEGISLTASSYYANRRFSHGLQYTEYVNDHYAISLELTSYSGRFNKASIEYDANAFDRLYKRYMGVHVGVLRKISLNDRNSLLVGAGGIGRRTTDQLIYANGLCPNCILFYDSYTRFEIGILTWISLEQNWTTWLKTYVEFRHSYTFFQNHNNNRQFFLDRGVPKSFFSRNETTINFGIGYSF